MKKVILTFILFIFSFFFFNLKGVFAQDYSYEIKESEIVLINDDFINLRNLVLEFASTKKYAIYKSSGSSLMYVAISKCDINSTSCPASISLSYTFADNVRFYFQSNSYDLYLYSNNELKFSSSITKDTYTSFFSINNYYNLLDTNCSLTTSSINTYTINYNDKSYIFPNDNPTLYNIYLDNLESENSYEEEQVLLLSFYNFIIEKISYLATIFATNYIFLTIIGVFILIFIIELVRRLLK